MTDRELAVLEEHEARQKAIVATNGARSVVTSDGAASITALLHLAVEKGTPVAELKELVALHEHMEKRAAAKAFAVAMKAFQTECKSIKHNKTAKITLKGGGQFSFTYASIDEVAEVINPILAEHGLSYTWNAASNESGALITVTCLVSHVDGHSVASSITLPTASDSAMSPQQKISAANNFGRRLSLESALGITTSQEDRAEPNAADQTPISDDQATALLDMVRETGADLSRFLNFMSIQSLDALPARRYGFAVQTLHDMQKRRAKAEQKR